MEFEQLLSQFQESFDTLAKDASKLFEVDLDRDALWELYLDSFPPGTNEVFRRRREFDCGACRQFVKNFGNVVRIKNNKVMTIWDFETGDSTYQPVMDTLSEYVRSKPVSDVYITKNRKVGTNKNIESTDGNVTEFHHFYLELPSQFVEKNDKSEAEIKGGYRDTRNVFKRSLDEISEGSLLTTLDLINQNSLYKGEEWKGVLTEFLKFKKAYMKLSPEDQENYVWEQSVNVGGAIGRIRNHSMGTLLMNITEGINLDVAVRKYEQIVAPSNYKRPKAIYTQKMLDDAKKTIEDLGYLDSLGGRHATIDDITVNNVLFINKDAMKGIEGGTNPNIFSCVEEISIDAFLTDVLPNANELEVFFENKHMKNMASLIAPLNKSARSMFKWDNAFRLSYTGNIADSELTEKVKAAGGSIDGVLRFSHSWNHEGARNASLMDLHVFMPGSTQKTHLVNGKEIHDNYGNGERVGWNNRKHHQSGGTQDVDYTNAAPVGYIPVENITFPSIDKLKEGVYTFKIHNWTLRQPTTGGFKAEIAFGGQVYRFERKEGLKDKEWVTLAKIELKNGEFRVLEMMGNDLSPVKMWGLETNQFVPVSVVCYSPNYWNEQQGIGHKHVMFMLKDCVNPERPNGFYNEYLKEELMPHRRVFEALGSKMAVQKSNDQLSGLSFSSTKRNEMVVKVKGQTDRILRIKF